MWDRTSRGNAVTEYGLILGLVTITAIGAFVLMGGSINDVLVNLVDSLKKNDSQVAVLGPSDNGGPQGIFITGEMSFDAGLEENSSGNPAPNALTGEMDLLTTTSSGETNATSVDGMTSVQAVNLTVAKAQKFEELAAQTDDPALQKWYTQAAEFALKIAGTEASYSYHADNMIQLEPLADTKTNKSTALWNLHQYYHQFSSQMQVWPYPGESPEKARAMSIGTQVVDSLWAGYGDVFGKYAYGTQNGVRGVNFDAEKLRADTGQQWSQNYSKMPDELRSIVPTMLKNGALDDSAAIKTVVQGSSTYETQSNKK